MGLEMYKHEKSSRIIMKILDILKNNKVMVWGQHLKNSLLNILFISASTVWLQVTNLTTVT